MVKIKISVPGCSAREISFILLLLVSVACQSDELDQELQIARLTNPSYWSLTEHLRIKCDINGSYRGSPGSDLGTIFTEL